MEKTLVLLEIKTLVPREVTLVSRVNCWCADQETFFFRENIMQHWCAEKALVSMVNCWCAEMVLVRGSGYIFFLEELSYVTLLGHRNCDCVLRESKKT